MSLPRDHNRRREGWPVHGRARTSVIVIASRDITRPLTRNLDSESGGFEFRSVREKSEVWRHRFGLVTSAVLIFAACSSAPSGTPAEESTSSPGVVGPSAVASPTEPNPTQQAHVLADLVADPLPVTTLEDVKTLEQVSWEVVDQINGWKPSDPEADCCPGQDKMVDVTAVVWVCATRAANVSEEQGALEREAACLTAIAEPWLNYLSTPQQSSFDRARALYAFAVASLGADARARLDASLANLPQPPPSQPLNTVSQLLAEDASAVTPTEIFRAVRDAVAAAPATWSTFRWASVQGVFNRSGAVTGATLARTLDTTAGLDPLIIAAWRSYKSSGAEEAYRLTLMAYQHTEPFHPRDCPEYFSCREYWLSSLKEALEAIGPG